MTLTGCASAQLTTAVNTPVLDLRARPHTAAQPNTHDPIEETQLLYGERVRVLTVRDGWARVEALEQPEFTHAKRWQGYPGWVPSSALTPWDAWREPTIVVTEKWADTWEDPHGLRRTPWRFPLGAHLHATDVGGELWLVELLDGTTVWMRATSAHSLAALHARSSTETRRLILRNAQLFVGNPYYWGGRSPQPPGVWDQVTGVDCSGLINLAYRAAGLDIPRDAHEQFLRAQPIRRPETADVIFLSARGHPKQIVHVMLYAGDGHVIEGPGTGQAVRRIRLEERLGRPLDELAPGAVIDGQTVFFGTFLP